MHFLQEKSRYFLNAPRTLIEYITEFSQKIGSQMHYWPPIRSGGGMAPLAPPPVADPMDVLTEYRRTDWRCV